MDFDFGKGENKVSEDLGSIDLTLDKQQAKGSVVPKIIAGAAVVAVLGVGGYFLLGRGPALTVPSATFSIPGSAPSVAADSVVLKVSYEGSTYELSPKAIRLSSQFSQAGLASDSGSSEDSADSDVISAVSRSMFAQSLVLGMNAQQVGLSPSESDLSNYFRVRFGASDLADAASKAGISKAEAQCLVWADLYSPLLQGKVKEDSGDALTGKIELPERVDGVEDDEKDIAYATYITDMAASEYDTEKMEWKSEDGPFYKALKDEDWDPMGATYYQALKAYNCAISVAFERSGSGEDPYTNYINTVMANATVELIGIA